MTLKDNDMLCNKCNNIIPADSVFCPFCGLDFHQTKTNSKSKIIHIIAYSVLSLVIIGLIITAVVMNSKLDKTSNALNELTKDSTNPTVVYITPQGNRYHRENCYTIENSNVYGTTISEAEEQGKTACSVCKPDEE